MYAGLSTASLAAQTTSPSTTSGTAATSSQQSASPLQYEMPKSHNPLRAYEPDQVPEPVLANSPRLDQLIRDGKLYLALKDAIDLALENNLDLAIARYNLPIANTDILRTQAGGFFRGVNTGVVQGTPGGGVGGFGTGAPGAGAGGTTSGAGGAGAGASGLVQSTLGVGTDCVVLRSIPQSQRRRRASDHPSGESANLWCAIAPAQYWSGSREFFAILCYRHEP